MEADLQRFYSIDYRDRWRGDLTLRRIWVLIRHLPDTSSVSGIERGDKPSWSIEAHLLDDIRMGWEGPSAKPHPLRPRPGPKVETAERKRKLADARRRARDRRARLDAEKGTTQP